MNKNLEQLGMEIDKASDQSDLETLSRCLARCAKTLKSGQKVDRPLIYYFQANTFSAIRQIKANDETYFWSWVQPELTREVLSLRQAIRDPHFHHLDKIRRCQILTNLGGVFNALGRPIKALEMRDSALRILPQFAMALGNRGIGLCNYSDALYDLGHQNIFLMQALGNLREALSPRSVWDGEYPSTVRENFQTRANEIKAFLDHNFDESHFEPYSWPIGTSKNEKKFRKWRLENRLFLNPLNDLDTWPIAAHDVFHLPDHSYGIDEKPRFVQFYDLLKQEYVAACLLLFEGSQGKHNHYADKEILVFEHGDGSIGGVRIEKQKVAFRSAYSILDKIAMFLNEYYDLGKDRKRLNFRTVWHEGRGKDINSRIPQNNWRLRSLYALSLDLFDSEFKETALPHAELLNDVRNAAEHRFLQVYEDGMVFQSDEITTRLAYTELYRLSLRMLKISRAALIYLSLAMYHQENVVSPVMRSGIDRQETPKR